MSRLSLTERLAAGHAALSRPTTLWVIIDGGWYEARAAAAVIPPKTNHKSRFDVGRGMYRWRQLAENYFAKFKEFRAITARYKTDTSYRAIIDAR